MVNLPFSRDICAEGIVQKRVVGIRHSSSDTFVTCPKFCVLFILSRMSVHTKSVVQQLHAVNPFAKSYRGVAVRTNSDHLGVKTSLYDVEDVRFCYDTNLRMT